MSKAFAMPDNTVQRLQLGAARIRERWQELSPAYRRALLTGVLALTVSAAAMVWWTGRTDWRVLMRGLEGRDAAQATQELAAAGVTYQTTPDGMAIEVPAEQLDKARVAIATKGMPQSGRFGFELFDKPNWIGSEFDEKVNYQRALEGELEHTIGTLESVRSARVHIVLPKQGAFSSEDTPAKASVVLKLRRSDLPLEQAASIRSLIAGAVEGLHVDAVTLVDADGRSDLDQPGGHAKERDQEVALEGKLISMLEPLAGPGNVRATVDVSYIEGSEEHTDEVYDPAGAVAVNTTRSENSAQSSRLGGIPGASSNTPAATPATAPAQTSGTAPGQTAGATPAAGNGQV